jgi:transcriptional regulator with XRE-family HTH domain
MPLRSVRPSDSLADRVRSIFAARGLSLADVSRASRLLVAGERRGYIPHNFYSVLRASRFSPSLYHLVTLSAVSGYRLMDWLAIFGISLDDVPRFQTAFPALRTVELDTRVYRSNSLIQWFYDLKEIDLSSPLAPLSRWLATGALRRLDSIFCTALSRYRYVKIGSEDALAFPDLVPGSIVRLNPRFRPPKRTARAGNRPGRVFLVEHSNGLVCARLCRSEARKIVLCSRHLPYAPVELEEGTEAVVRGVADLEIRPLGRTDRPVVPATLGRFWTPSPLPKLVLTSNAGEFIRHARKKSGLSFRQASERTRLIARELDDSQYYCSPSALSDYETRRLPPRHVHKLVSICAVYFASAAEFLKVSGVGLVEADKLPMPEEFFDLPSQSVRSSARPSQFLKEIKRRFKEIPCFLHRSLPSMFGLPEISLRDVFWVGAGKALRHSYSAGAHFMIVDRKQKNPRPSLSSPVWAQPVYVLQLRDGSYLWGFCSLQNRVLVLRPCVAGRPKLQRLRNRVDAEVIGKVVGIVRALH